MSGQATGHVDADALPPWLRPVAARLDGVEATTLSPQMPTPPVDSRPASVLMLFGESDDTPDLLLTERAHTMRSHPGQIAFPGGAREPEDTGPEQTALREAHEEVGLDPAGVDVFGLLPPLWMPGSNFAVTTVLGWWRAPTAIDRLEPSEVASAFRTPLADLLDPDRRFSVRLRSGWLGPAFALGDGLILWGFTAGIVARLFAYVGWERPWDASHVQTLPDRAPSDQPLPDEELAVDDEPS